ncbi:heparinase II/III domain-containing protein [Natrononativus amylolyticus]|uniref:heparinase II/III domain-containing protein n=1 Tax=Natrononativus amylolyticus TaxID=2963434 RepID=UPI0020CD5E28|nr:heparinase II/III family protein [Natrononativus amylolyticus]
MLATTGAGILGGLLSTAGTAGAQESDALNAKTRPTIWTEEDRENARNNVEQYDWAEDQRDSAISRVESRLEDWQGRFGSDADTPDLESLWRVVTSQKIPRGAGPGPTRFISQDGERDGQMWKTDTGVDNPEGEGTITVPTNDFEAYRQSGLDDRGMFDPDLADDDLLVNEEHPELGEGWGVDDGWGWYDEENVLGAGEGTRWNFVAHYNHWAVWHHGGGISRVLTELTDAYLLTGDQEYARAGTVMLDRIADVYPEMDMTVYTETLHGFWNSHGGMQTGKVVGAYWESNALRPIIQAYDAFFPAMEGDDELVEFLEAKTDEFPGLEEKDSVEKIRKNIEDNILREILPAMKNINMDSGGNSALVQAARVLDEPDGYSKEAIEWVFQPGEHIFDGDVWDEEPENWNATGGGLLVPMVDVWDRDGYNNRAGPGYNTIQLSGTREVADYLQGYDGFDGADLYQHPKLQQSLDVNVPLLVIDRFTPQIGNQHGPYTSEWNSTSIQKGFEVIGESLFAQVWHFDQGYSTDGIQGSIFDEDPEGLSEEIDAIIQAEGPLDLPSRNLPGYGFAALKDGNNYGLQIRAGAFDTSEIFVEASVEVNDSFPEAIQLQANDVGEWWRFEFDLAEGGEYEFEIDALFGPTTYGIYELYVNDELVDTIDFMADADDRDTISYDLDLLEGTNEMYLECVGKNDDSDNYLMALYEIAVLDEEDQDDEQAALGNAKRAIWMYYGRNGTHSHNHKDALNIGVAAHDLELAPDLGYPEETGSHPKRLNWTENTISHNTVTVDESEQDSHWVGIPRHFDGEDERVNLIDVDAFRAYDQCEEYRRTTAMIEVDEAHSYGVDLFRVAGGDDHVFSFHGQAGEASAEGVDLVPQDGGTYAGEDVPKPDYGEDTEYNQENGSGFNYLTNVARDDSPGSKVTVDWDVIDHYGHRDDNAEGVHLRLTTFGEFDEVALADGHPPDRDGNPDSLDYALFNREGEDVESEFLSLIEHYDGERVVEDVEEVEVAGGEGRALKVELTTGRTDYVVCSFEKDEVVVDDTFEFEGFFGVYCVEGGDSEYAYVHDGTLLAPTDEEEPLVEESQGFVGGVVEDFTRGMSLENELDVQLMRGRSDLERHTGFVYVDNDDSNPWRDDADPKEKLAASGQRGRGNGVYEIEDIESGHGNRYTVGVGRQTFVRQFTDPDQLEDGGYEYMISEDDDIRIPLSAAWDGR